MLTASGAVVALQLPLIQFMMVDAADVVDAMPCSWRVLAGAVERTPVAAQCGNAADSERCLVKHSKLLYDPRPKACCSPVEWLVGWLDG